MKTIASTHVNISADVLFQELEGEILLLDLQKSRYYKLNSVGARIWQLLFELGNTADVFEQMQIEYSTDEAVLQQDLSDLVKQLEDAGLVTTTL